MKTSEYRIITLDTNILVRFFVADDDKQYHIAQNLFETADRLVIPTTVFVEIIWVLSSVYKVNKTDIIQLLTGFIDSMPNLIIRKNELKAGFDMMLLNGDFADGINHYLGMIDGANLFATFDKKAVKVLQERGYQAQLLK